MAEICGSPATIIVSSAPLRDFYFEPEKRPQQRNKYGVPGIETEHGKAIETPADERAGNR